MRIPNSFTNSDIFQVNQKVLFMVVPDSLQNIHFYFGTSSHEHNYVIVGGLDGWLLRIKGRSLFWVSFYWCQHFCISGRCQHRMNGYQCPRWTVSQASPMELQHPVSVRCLQSVKLPIRIGAKSSYLFPSCFDDDLIFALRHWHQYKHTQNCVVFYFNNLDLSQTRLFPVVHNG